MLSSLRRRLLPILLVLAVIAGFFIWNRVSSAPSYTTESFRFDSDAAEPATLDATIYVPDDVSADDPAPAVILAHGFGGTKDSVAADAADLAERGFIVLAYTARGFGTSTGQIGLNAPDAEIADASNLITWLSERDDVVQDGDGDPRVGIAGGSYGGALALLTAGHDDRVDAIVPMITWNRLSRVFFPNGAGNPDGLASPAYVGADEPLGPFKREWAGIFFGFGKGVDLAGALLGAGDGGGADGGPDAEGDSDPAPANGLGAPSSAGGGGMDPACGRFTPTICALYVDAAETGIMSPEQLAVLDASSPYSIAGDIKAPTFLIQGQLDSLFPLSEADVTARQIAAGGGTVKVAWSGGGHDEGGIAATDDELAELRDDIGDWFGHYLAGEGSEPADTFSFNEETGLTLRGGRPTNRQQIAPSYPDAPSTTESLALAAPPQTIVRPAGGVPGSLSTLPGLGGLGISFDPPGQAAMFATSVLDAPVSFVGSATVRITVAGVPEGTTLFAKIYDSSGSGLPLLPGGAAVPVVVPPNPGTVDVDVVLPAIAHRFEGGHRMIVAFATTDRAYGNDPQQQIMTVSLAGDDGLAVPLVDAETEAAGVSDWLILAGFVAAAGLLAGALALWMRRRRARQDERTFAEDLADVPLVAENLRKAYGDGYVAVKDVSFRVERNQVVGLLGPNGAGKTTSLRMLMGLIQPTGGRLRVFGHEIYSGAPVLSRIGCFVEGVGLMPHLSGRENLKLYWAATGRPVEDAGFDRVLEIAGLGTAVERKVRTYSQGMRQRLAIAQAMLGLPELLVLDEPTNGLDPPQIAEMRQVLRTYARDGRSVLVSSHQLSEVEATCSHVVVIDKGEVIAGGSVADVVGVGAEVNIGTTDVAAASEVLSSYDGIRVLDVDDDVIGIEVVSDDVAVSDVVAELVRRGVPVDRVLPRRRLEDAFLALVGGAH